MNQMELIGLMDKILAANWLAALETKEHPQEQEAVEACEAFYEELSSFVQ